ncbi:hypothetical protein PQQ51_01740 [Paraburkholderia xenovorans]|uniref:hypothetical protein n=1 Tax=Paraburkholderia xenovorans TaxID=36873 RepID=UPI0038BB8FDD
MKQQLLSTISGRQLNVTAGVPGTGRTINGPLRAGVPGQSHAGVAGPPGPLGEAIKTQESTHDDPALEDARNLLNIASAMAASLRKSEIAVYERPAPSKTRRFVTTVAPWLKPASLQDLASFTDGAGNALTAPAPRRDPMISRNRIENGQQARELLAEVERRRQTLDSAVDKLVAARSQHEAACDAGATGEDIDQAASQIRIEEASVRAASGSLHEAIHSTDLLEVISLSHLSDQADKKLAFSLQRLNDIRKDVETLHANSGSRRDEIELEIKAHAEEASLLRSFDYDMSATEEIVAQTAARLNRLSARLGNLTDSGTDTYSTEAEAAGLREKIEETRGVLNLALEKMELCQQRLYRFAELNDNLGDLMKKRAQVDRHWHVADRTMPSLRNASAALEERQGAANEATGNTSGDKNREKDAINAARQYIVEQSIQAAHGFGPQTPPGLATSLERLALKLTAPQPPIPMLPQAVLEIVTRAIADVGVDVGEDAARVLDLLAQHPVTHWVEVAAEQSEPLHEGEGSTPVAVDDSTRIVALCRKMATLPRGTDMLHVLSSDGAQAPDSARSQMLRVFWNAHDAQQAERSSDNGVADWLQQAKRVAHAGLTSASETTFDDVDHAAYNAVRNGYFSNAPGSAYDRHNLRLRKAITEWVIRAAASDSGTERSRAVKPDDKASGGGALWRRKMPTLNKTPYRKRVLNRAYAVAESMGMQSPRIKVDAHVKRRIAELERTIATCRDLNDSPQLRKAMLAAQATVDHLKLRQNRGEHLSQIKLQAKDAKNVSRRIGADGLNARRTRASNEAAEPAGANRQRNVLRKAAPVVLPEFFEQVCSSGLTAYEAVNRIEEHLNTLLPERLHRADTGSSAADDTDLAAAAQLLKAEHFSSKTDIVTFFRSFVLNSRLRDRLRIGAGGTLGVNLPTLPYGAVSPIASPIVTAEKSMTDEAFVQLFMPILGMEMSFGSAHTQAKEATVGVAVGPQVAPGVSLQATFTARAASQQTRTDSTLMRFFRSRHKDEEMRANMLNALDSMVRWDMIAPDRGRAFKDPLEAIFARNPAVVVTQVESFTDTKTLTARVSARLPSARFNDAHGVAQTLGAEVAAFVEAERTRDKRSETGGQIRVVNAKSDTAQQRAGATVNLNFAPLTNQSIPIGPAGRDGVVQRESVPMQLGVSRDFAWVKEQHEISPFLIGDKQDGDLDRHYSTPKDMLAEIAGNRENWLMRCIETLDPDENGEKDNPRNRQRAAVLLDTFEQDIMKLGKTTNYCHYNVNYSMRGEAGAWIDGYRALAELALQRGDHEGARKAQQSIDEVLLMRATWRPLMLIVRERARDSTTLGWRSLIRWQKNANVDGQRTAAQFPPP